MRWNENEVAALAHQPPEWEGRLMHKAQQHGRSAMSRFANGRNGEFKERWVRLRANCLFYWRYNNISAPPLGSEPLGLLVLEASHAQQVGAVISVCKT